MSRGLVLREARIEDARALLEWRNDPETRARSFTTAEVPGDEHMEWLRRVLSDPEITLYIAELDGVRVGTVRLERNRVPGGLCEISWTVAPGARGRGIGKKMVAGAVSGLSVAATARIRHGNTASERIARAAGFRLEGEDDDATYWRRPPESREDR